MSSEKTVEKYYILASDALDSLSQQNYVLLNPSLPYTAYSQCTQANMYTQPGSILAGVAYNNIITQKNTDTNTLNITNNVTFSLENGILVFVSSKNVKILPIGHIIRTKPIFQSGIYEGKDVEITRVLIEFNNETIAEYTVKY